MILIGLAGRKGSGKNTAGDILEKEYGFTQLSFAAPLKASAAALLNVSVADLEEWKNDPEALVSVFAPGEWEGRAMSVREFLQRYGTEAHRDIFGEDFWTKQLIDQLPEKGKFVITDARFDNECAAIQNAGGYVVYIDRPGTDDGDTHASEVPPADDLIYAKVLNDSTIEALQRKLDVLLQLIDGRTLAAVNLP